ncbi:MAG: D-sedoheptulose 7-phosphate isomerase [Acidobacteria bacterium]|nr:D-sedoheptulose 7-phosphate isomerase [Acidobacteriota bacterium]
MQNPPATPEASPKPTEAMLPVIAALAHESVTAKQRFFAEQAVQVAEAAQLIIEAMREGHKLLLFGNGGSAADAQHIAAELAFKMGRERQALPALALTTDTSLLTAISNDRSFDYVFARQIKALGQPGDVALALSTSGNSPNITAALKQAREQGLVTIGLLGNTGGVAAALVDLALIVPHTDTPRIQEVHIAASHIICQLIEDALCPA